MFLVCAVAVATAAVAMVPGGTEAGVAVAITSSPAPAAAVGSRRNYSGEMRAQHWTEEEEQKLIEGQGRWPGYCCISAMHLTCVGLACSCLLFECSCIFKNMLCFIMVHSLCICCA